MRFQTKRIYEPASNKDGYRVLIDRLWPRGLTKANAKVDLWAKDLAPSTTLRKWFNHDPAKFEIFRERYALELEAQCEAARDLIAQAPQATVTLLYAARDTSPNHAVVLATYLSKLSADL